MPTISIFKKDFESLLGSGPRIKRPVSIERLEDWLMLVKGELKEHVAETDELRVELQDSNRPDLWSCEGIARQVRIKLTGSAPSYSFFNNKIRPERRLLVAPGLEKIRPYVAACTASGYTVSAAGLAQLIQVQEKLADIYGRKSSTISIGLYRLPNIVCHVTYDLVKPPAANSPQLVFKEKMSIGEILA